MKQETRERAVSYIVYIANDGTEFTSKGECETYENTAKGVLLGRYQQLVVKSSTEYEVFGIGSDEDELDFVKISTEEDINTVLQLLNFNNPYLFEEGNKASLKPIEEYCRKALYCDELLITGTGYNRESFYIEGTQSTLLEKVRQALYPEISRQK